MSDTDLNRWQLEQDILNQVLEEPEHQRQQVLTELCGDRSDLREAVSELLAAWLNSSHFLEQPVIGIEDPTMVVGPQMVGERFGNYEIVGLVGHGGMGSVYLAKRIDGTFDRNVAIKILRSGVLGQEMLRRFEVEGKILAALDHANIAKLLDAGSTPSTGPYIVMEHVDGIPIDQYVTNHKLSIKERLRLFRLVADAVEHAHRNLIVHRDLKPSNILVTGNGEPKLLDFGIAKLLGSTPWLEAFDQTKTKMNPMTPRYASPEQRKGLSITTSSDVYSLGVLLFKLLTGVTPDFQGEYATGPGTRSTCPSEAIQRQTGTDFDKTGRDSVAWHKAIKGDLDNIVMMALRHDPERRYGSVSAFSEDLDRYLKGLPVKARQETFWYVASKFAKRNALAVAGFTCFVLLLVSFVVTANIQSRRVAAERDRAELERDKANSISKFLVDLFENADPDKSKGGELTVREVLDDGALRLRSEMDSQPEVKATLLNTMGKVYFLLGKYNDAQAVLNEGLSTWRELGPVSEKELANALELLAVTNQFNGNYAIAEQHYLECLQIRQRILEPLHRDIASINMNLGSLYLFQSQYDQAQPYLENARDIAIEVFGPDHGHVADCLDALAGNQRAQGHIDDALVNYERSLAIRRKQLGEHHSAVSYSLNNVALASMDRNPQKAASYFEQALTIYEKTIGLDHTNTANTLFNLSSVDLRQGYFVEADRLRERALQIQLDTFGLDHESIAEFMHGLGISKCYLGHYEASIHLLQRAYHIRSEGHGDKNKSQQVLFELSCALFQSDDLNAAEDGVCEVLDVCAKNPVRDAKLAIKAELLRARIRLTQGRNNECDQLLDHLRLQIASCDLTDDHSYWQSWDYMKGRVLNRQGRGDEAKVHFNAILTRTQEHNDPLTLWDRVYEAKAYFYLGDYESLQKLLPILRNSGIQDRELDPLFTHYNLVHTSKSK